MSRATTCCSTRLCQISYSAMRWILGFLVIQTGAGQIITASNSLVAYG